jgi:hypothetical protein
VKEKPNNICTMKQIKTTIVAAFLTFFMAASYAQDGIVAEFNAEKPAVVVSEDGQTTTEFTLICSEDEMKSVSAEAGKYESYITFTSTANDAGTYNCSMIFRNKVNAAYVQKMLTSFRIGQFKYNGETHKITAFSATVK